MKVLVLNGSPKKVSDTMQLTNAFLKGLCTRDAHGVEIIHVIEKNIKPCRGCFGCWEKGNGRCVIMNDDQNEILEKYVAADLVIWSFPLYCYGLPSHLKAVMDRTLPFAKMDMVEHDGEVSHVSRVDLSKQKRMIICGAGFPDSEGNFEGVRITGHKCLGDPIMIFVPETPMMNAKDAEMLADRKRGSFEKAGIEYAESGTLKEETILELESLMIPNEAYIQMINCH